jgi:hypothetical protein
MSQKLKVFYRQFEGVMRTVVFSKVRDINMIKNENDKYYVKVVITLINL